MGVIICAHLGFTFDFLLWKATLALFYFCNYYLFSNDNNNKLFKVFNSVLFMSYAITQIN